MHLTKRVLPFIIAEALKGKTWVQDAVFDSPGDIGSIRVADEGGLFVAIYCDEWDLKRDDQSDVEPEAGPGSFKLVIEVGAARPLVTEKDEEGPVSQITATDQGLEWQIAFISRQCVDTLLMRGPAFPWSELFQKFISSSMQRYSIRRGGPANDGKSPAARYAACVSIFKVSVSVMEPPRGQVITAKSNEIWNELMSLMREREDMQGLEKLIRAHFEPVDGKDLSEAKIDGQRMWVPDEIMTTLGLGEWAKTGYAGASGGIPSAEPVRGDVPIDDRDMSAWLAAQEPDPSQGGSNGQ